MLLRQVRRLGDPRPVDLLLRDGRIAQIGPDLSILRDRSAGRDTDEVIDGGGAVVIPGLWDQHVHVGQAAEAHGRFDTTGVHSVAQLLTMVRDAVADAPVGPVVGFGHRLLELDAPLRVADLDRVSAESVPAGTPAPAVVLISGDAHHAWVNTAGLAALGLPPRSGVVAEEEWFLAAPRLAELPGQAARREAGVAALQERALARGVVGLVDLEWSRTWEDWTRRTPRLRVRCGVYPGDLAQAPGPSGRVLDADGLVTMGPLKVITDGALGSRTAFCHDPYPGAAGPEGRGVLSVGTEELSDLLHAARSRGLHAAIHAIGDAAVTSALEALSRVPMTARIEHAQWVRDSDLHRFAISGAVASVQPAHLLDDRDPSEEMLAGHGGELFRLRDLLRVGVPLLFGSDAPVAPLDPWEAMAAAVHRSADHRPAWHDDQALQPAEALAASTDGVASVEVGGPADLVLLEDDLFGEVTRRAAARLRHVRPLATIVAGRLAFSR
ncbi:amidohydrolase family protein [Brachybacterium sp. EF45031]|uniref:amidohydrolase n=1 Tax=Brachybacterium sillae TaxID=2810536 RepID=UPI00217EA364|nr:amidohydrolase family protein [Brachybacterium sillae]MCS6712012.1 amidohydrolase family protein [Brachybacterium sillae]